MQPPSKKVGRPDVSHVILNRAHEYIPVNARCRPNWVELFRPVHLSSSDVNEGHLFLVRIIALFIVQSASSLDSRVVSVLDSGAEGPGSNRSRDAVG